MQQFHRSTNNYHYSGIPIHAGVGLHECASELCLATLPKNSTILELGSGSGAFTKRLMDLGFKVLSCDIDPIGFAAEVKSMKVDLNKDFADLFSEYNVQAIVCLEIIEHLENPQHFLRQLNKISKSDTKIFISFPNIYLHSSIRNFLYCGEFASWNISQYWEMGHQTILTDWIFESHCKKYGFNVDRKIFTAEMNLKLFYPQLFKRAFVYLFLLFVRLVSKDINRNKLTSDCVLFQISTNK